MSREEYAGSVLKQLADSYAFMERCSRFRATFEGLERNDYYDVPPIAMREALANSVAHREYALSGLTLVSVMPGGMAIVSPGGLPLGIEEADLDAHVSMYGFPGLHVYFAGSSVLDIEGVNLSRRAPR